MIRILAPAKLNLGLEILGRRPDGFHELRTIFCAVSQFDKVTVALAAENCVACHPAPDSTRNLAEVALSEARVFNPAMPHVRVTIAKGIPAAAGLGGASSDAAATLLALRYLDSGSMTLDQLTTAALRCGSDVPFFLHSGAALGQGRGEELIPIQLASPINAVIITPNVTIPDKTRTMYRCLVAADWTTGAHVESLASLLATGGSLPLDGHLPNAFRRSLYDLFPKVRSLAERIEASCGLPVQISGAGPSLFVLCADMRGASRIQSVLRTMIDRDLASVRRVRSVSSVLIAENPDV